MQDDDLGPACDRGGSADVGAAAQGRTARVRVVCKYGGSSLATADKIAAVARQLAARHRAGQALVVVCSAQGGTTDALLAQAQALAELPPKRELDMLLTCGERAAVALMAIALAQLGVPALSLTGSQAGIVTDERHQGARIVAVRPQRIEAALAAHRVVVVAGYQGVSRGQEITTLGRGGSDVTAIALWAALGADEVHILSDVDGVYDADPRRVPAAQHLAHVDYAQMHLLAQLGARVLHPEAVRLAEALGIEVCAGEAHGAQARATRVGAPPVPPGAPPPAAHRQPDVAPGEAWRDTPRAVAVSTPVLLCGRPAGAAELSTSTASPEPTDACAKVAFEAACAALGGTCLLQTAEQDVWSLPTAPARRAARAAATAGGFDCVELALVSVVGADVGPSLWPVARAALAAARHRVLWRAAFPRQLSVAVAVPGAEETARLLHTTLVGGRGATRA